MSFTFRVDLRGVVDLLSHHLYATPRVYVRELMQNAVDAITARRLADPHASVRERDLFGFPPPGHEYWNEQTVHDVGRRYKGMDMEPYRPES